MSDWLGHLHPVLLHYPFGLLAALVVLEVVAWRRADRGPSALRTWLYGLTAWCGLAAGASGWVLGHAGEETPLVERHEQWGIGFAVLLVVLWMLAWRRPAAARARLWLLAAALPVAVSAGHLGGTMTHGRGFVGEGSPGWFRGMTDGLDGLLLPALDAPADGLAGGAVYALLERRCVECHGPDKQKGKLRLDTRDGLESVLDRGAPLESELIYRIGLPVTHEDVMPPEEEERLAAEDIATLVAWVLAGAPMGAVEEAQAVAESTREAGADLLARLRAQTGAVLGPATGFDPVYAAERYDRFVAQAGGAPLAVDFSLGSGAVSAVDLAELAPLRERVVELSLAGRAIEVEGALPAVFPNLDRLHLERSGADAEALRRILRLAPHASYLNLHGTGADDALLAELRTREELRRLVLHDTRVSAEALAAFRAARPAVEVTADLALPLVADRDRRILAADASKGVLALLREKAIGNYEVEWQRPIEQLHDLQRTPQGTILYQNSWTRLVEVDPATDTEVWSFDAAAWSAARHAGPVEVHSFGRLADGATFVAVSGAACILEVEVDGTVRREIALQVERPDPHHDTRLVRPTPSGTYLVAHENDGVVREYARDGTLVWQYAVPLFGRERAPGHDASAWGNQVFGVLRRANGNTLITTGNGHRVLEVDAGGALVWSLSDEDLPGMTLAWTTVIEELPGGTLLVGNCHAGPAEPQLFEVSRDKQVMWTFRDLERFGDALSNATVWEGPLRGE